MRREMFDIMRTVSLAGLAITLRFLSVCWTNIIRVPTLSVDFVQDSVLPTFVSLSVLVSRWNEEKANKD